jgi:hypothetical protein
MLAAINPALLPALRIAATFVLIVNIVGGTYIFRNRHRFFDQDPNISEDTEPRSQTKGRGHSNTMVRPNSVSCHLVIYLWSV